MSRSDNVTNNQGIRSQKQINLTATHPSQRLLQSRAQTTGAKIQQGNKVITVPRVQELERPATTVKEWLAQIKNQSFVQVSFVKANPTNKGVEVVLQTSLAATLQLQNRTQVNSNIFIVDIPNAQLRLPGDRPFTFRSQKPIAGVTEITVTNFDANTIRVTVIGEASPPVVELYDSPKEGLIFNVSTAASIAQQQRQNPTPKPSPNLGQGQESQQPGNQTQPSQPSASGDEPIELVVTGEQDGYRVSNTRSATRTDTDTRDIPQSIQAIPQTVIKDQQITRIIDATRNVSGVSPLAGFGGIFDDYTIRGFSSYNILRNGFKTTNIFSYGANVERVEVLKGPASVLYGQFEPGGVVNYVTKQPLSNPYYAAEFTAGSFSFYRGSVDFSGPLTNDKKLLYRLNVAYENSGSFRDFNDYDIFSVSPVITYKPSENTILNFEYEYGRRRGGFDRGFPPTSPVFLTLPISRNLGEPSDFNNVDYQRGTLTLDHRFSDSLQLRSGVSIQSSLNNDAYANIGGGTFEADGRSLQREYGGDRDRPIEDYSWQTDLIGKFNTGSIAHQLLLGLELSRNTDVDYNFAGDIASLDIFNPIYGARPTNIRLSGLYDNRIDTIGIYLQDQVALLSNLKLLVGGRYDFVDSVNSVTRGDGNTTRSEFNDGAFSPRVGLVYQPIEPISLYASYSRSFVPNNSRTASGEALEPSRGTQYEIGIKSELFDRRLSATLAAYDITKTNIPTQDPNDINSVIAVGEVKSRGIELDVAGEILPGWKIIASGYLNDAFVSEDNDPTIKGQRLQNTAYHGASLWTTYEIQKGDLQGLQFSAGLFFVGSRIANQSDPFTLPSYVRTDAAISYKHDNWRAALNFKNIFDVKYYDTNGYLVFPQAPLTVLGTISVEF
ncbi:MAG: TonB-dependent siderophore receptor [Brasilonema angustatum HA4187-MV1]|nr:TonB-dependent siderophore receptor [Brasilonema angustatum HA4187-MV1]